jgi:hypothetical protein
MNAKPEYTEGPEAGRRFDALVQKVFSVSHDEVNG